MHPRRRLVLPRGMLGRRDAGGDHDGAALSNVLDHNTMFYNVLWSLPYPSDHPCDHPFRAG